MSTTLPPEFWPEAPEVVRDFTRRILAEVKDAGVQVALSEGNSIAYPTIEGGVAEIVASGFFVDRPVAVLGLSTAGDWQRTFPILVHEFSHFRQWKEDSQVWRNLYHENRDAPDWIDGWLAGEEVDPDLLKGFFKATRAVEMDCERRVLEHIAREGLPIDPVDYAQRANAYVHFYHVVEAHRKWRSSDSTAPYEDPAVFGAAPGQLTDPEACPPALLAVLERTYGPQPEPVRARPKM